MGNSHRKPVSVKLGGPAGRAALLLDFTNICRALRTCLRNVERCVTENKPAIEYEVLSLRSGSAILEALPCESDGNAVDQYEEVRVLFDATVVALQSNREIDPRLDYAAIRSFQGFCSPLSNDGARVEINNIEITNVYVACVKKLLEPDFKSLGSVSGRLETLDTHEQHVFVLYPAGTKEYVSCRFDKDIIQDVLSAHGRHVTVCGMLHYSKGKAFPVRVDVDSFDVHPEDDKIPSLIGAMGLLANSPGSSEEIIRAMHDEWE